MTYGSLLFWSTSQYYMDVGLQYTTSLYHKEYSPWTSCYLTMVISRCHISLFLFSGSGAFCWSHLCAENKAQNQTKPFLVLFWSDATSVAFSKKPAQMAEKLLQRNLIKSQLHGIKPYSYWEFVLTMYYFL